MSDMKNIYPKQNSNKLSETQLNAKLNTYQPAPHSDLLAGRILKTARATPQDTVVPAKTYVPANDTRFKYWPRIAAVCLIAFATTFSVMTLNPTSIPETDETVWQEAALQLGLDDIYDWVEEDVAAN